MSVCANNEQSDELFSRFLLFAKAAAAERETRSRLRKLDKFIRMQRRHLKSLCTWPVARTKSKFIKCQTGFAFYSNKDATNVF
jgi:hypothetical protein